MCRVVWYWSCATVEAAMRQVARKKGADEEIWGVIG